MTIATYDLQQGASLTLGTDSLTLRIISITPIRRRVPAVRTTHLGTATNHTWMGGELRDYEEVVVVYQNSPAVAQPTLSTAQTITVTAPVAPSGSVGENVTGTAFVLQDDPLPGFSAESEALQTKQMTFKWDGLTGPTRTAGS